MEIQRSSLSDVLTTSAPEILLTMAVLFLIPIWLEYGFDLTSQGLQSHLFLVGSVVGIMIPSLAYIGYLLVSSVQKHFGQRVKPVATSIILVLCGLPGASFWYFRLEGVEWGVMFFLSPLLLIVPAASLVFLRRRKTRKVVSSSQTRPPGFTGVVLFSTYVIALLCYISVISIGGTLLSDAEREFVDNLGINVIFWFLLPVHSVAVLVYTIAYRECAASRQRVIVRIALCVGIVFLSYSALIFVPARVYGT